MFKQETVSTSQVSKIYADMLQDFCEIKINNSIELSESQKYAYDKFVKGKNVLVIGKAGVGKSVLIKYIKDNTCKTVYVTATTGVSAYNIGGMTIHSYMGFGTGEADIDTLYTKMSKIENTFQRIINTDILIIDEISMMSAEFFEKIHCLCCRVRNNGKLFGGIQLILTGDFNQLQPVFNSKNLDRRLLIESKLFLSEFKKDDNIVELKTNFRQKNDPIYSNILNNIRQGFITEEQKDLLEERLNHKADNNIIKLVPTNNLAKQFNDIELNKIKSQKFIFKADYSPKNISNLLKFELTKQFMNKGLELLELKSGARVMLVKNLSVNEGLINGALGTIIEIKNTEITVKFDSGLRKIITKAKWEIQDPFTKDVLTAKQFPLILAYSITIHKSQSLSLEKANIYLEKCFCENQIYVALSRVKTLDGLYINYFCEDEIKRSDKIVEYLTSIGCE